MPGSSIDPGRRGASQRRAQAGTRKALLATKEARAAMAAASARHRGRSLPPASHRSHKAIGPSLSFSSMHPGVTAASLRSIQRKAPDSRRDYPAPSKYNIPRAVGKQPDRTSAPIVSFTGGWDTKRGRRPAKPAPVEGDGVGVPLQWLIAARAPHLTKLVGALHEMGLYYCEDTLEPDIGAIDLLQRCGMKRSHATHLMDLAQSAVEGAATTPTNSVLKKLSKPTRYAADAVKASPGAGDYNLPGGVSEKGIWSEWPDSGRPTFHGREYVATTLLLLLLLPRLTHPLRLPGTTVRQSTSQGAGRGWGRAQPPTATRTRPRDYSSRRRCPRPRVRPSRGGRGQQCSRRGESSRRRGTHAPP